MIINKFQIRNEIKSKCLSNCLFKILSKNLTTSKINFDFYSLNKLIGKINTNEKLNFEFKINDFENHLIQINIQDQLNSKLSEADRNQEVIKNEHNSYYDDNLNIIEKFFECEYKIEENKIIAKTKNINKIREDNLTEKIDINFNLISNLNLRIKNSKNIKIEAFDFKSNQQTLLGPQNNYFNFDLDCENSKVKINKNILYSNIKIKALNSEIKCQELYSNRRFPDSNFKNFEEALLNSREKEEILPEYQSDKEININTENSILEIDKIKNFNSLNLSSNSNWNLDEDKNQNNHSIIKINSLEVRHFDIQLNPNDKLKMNLYHLVENSIFRMKNIDFGKVIIKIHPMLIFNLNVYNTNKGKFQKNLIFDNEGYSFCPTIIFDIDKELPKNYLIGYELVKFSKYFKIFWKILILSLFVKILFLSDNCLDNCSEIETSFNTINNLHREISEYKFYQLAMKNKFNKLLENIKN